MALSLKDPQVDRLAREVADLTGETLTEAIRVALAERLAREQLRRARSSGLAERLLELGRQTSALADLDPRSPEDILGYNDHGLPR